MTNLKKVIQLFKYFFSQHSILNSSCWQIDKIPRIQGRKEKSLEKFATSPDGSLIAFVGNDGYIIIVEVKSKMWVADLKLNGSARAVSFSPDGDFVIASGSDGDIYRYVDLDFESTE